MNQPTREEFERLEEKQRRLEEEVHQLRLQITEPIRIDRLEIDRGGTQELLKETNKKLDQIIQTQTDRSERFDTLEYGIQELKQDLNTHAEAWLNTLQEHYTEHKHDISDVQTVQRGHAKYFEEHGKRLAATATKEDISRLESTMATKDDIATMATKDDIATMATKDDIATMATKDDIATMATKDDIATMATKDDIATMATKDDIAELKALIFKLLPKTPES